MEQNKLLTIAIPTYNGSKTISDMLKILLPQVTENVEIIISDNASTDNTEVIIKSFMKSYPFIKYIRNESNVGADRNFLQCMNLATGKYCMLLSDDDILVEGALTKILQFLQQNENISLAFLYTISFKDKYIDIMHCKNFKEYSRKPLNNIVTTDKKEFFSYVGRQWGFTSSFLWNTKRCQKIKEPERFFDSYWLQSYVHILCSNKFNDELGVIAGPCIAAGGYGVIPNYDAYEVEVVSFKNMLDFACIEAGYNKEQLTKFWLWKVCFILKRTLIKERGSGKEITSFKNVFEYFKKYPYAWIHLFPYLLLPKSLCKVILKIVRKKEKRNFYSYINRETN